MSKSLEKIIYDRTKSEQNRTEYEQNMDKL